LRLFLLYIFQQLNISNPLRLQHTSILISSCYIEYQNIHTITLS